MGGGRGLGGNQSSKAVKTDIPCVLSLHFLDLKWQVKSLLEMTRVDLWTKGAF